MALTMKQRYERINLSKLPDNYSDKFKAIKEDTENFDPELVDIFDDAFNRLYKLVEDRFPDAIKKGGTVTKTKPTTVKKPVAKAKKAPAAKKKVVAKKQGDRPASKFKVGDKVETKIGNETIRETVINRKWQTHELMGVKESGWFYTLTGKGKHGNFRESDLKLISSTDKKKVVAKKKDDFRTMISDATGITDKDKIASIHLKMLGTLDPKDEKATLSQLSDKEFSNLAKKFAGQSVSEKTFTPKSRGKKKTDYTIKKGDVYLWKEPSPYAEPEVEVTILEVDSKEVLYTGPGSIGKNMNIDRFRKGIIKKIEGSGANEVEQCRKILSEAGYTLKQKKSADGKKTMKRKVIRQERTIIKDKVDDTFKTVLKDISGSEEKDVKYKEMQAAIEEMKTLITKLFNYLNNLAEDNSVDKVKTINSLLKKLVP
jgi:hypothetical protein